jgi:hypothetical protein
MTAAHLPSAVQTVLMPKLTAAFMDGFHRGCLVAAGTAVVVAVIVFCYLPARQTSSKSELVLEH